MPALPSPILPLFYSVPLRSYPPLHLVMVALCCFKCWNIWSALLHQSESGCFVAMYSQWSCTLQCCYHALCVSLPLSTLYPTAQLLLHVLMGHLALPL